MDLITNQQRLDVLKNYRIIDTSVEEEFEAITRIASYVCQSPISLVTFIDKDRQWFKSALGVGELKETPLSIAFCTHTIKEEEDYMVINDLTKDERFVQNPFVTGEPYVKFYAGVSLKSPEGEKLGTVCVFDDKPRELDEKQLECLKTLSRHAISLLEERKKNRELTNANNSQKSIIEQLEQFSYAIAHDIKSPLRTMASFSDLLTKRAQSKLNDEELEFLGFIKNSAKELSSYTQRLLQFAQESTINLDNIQEVCLSKMLGDLQLLLSKDNNVEFQFSKELPNIYTSKTGLYQVLKNLIGNSIRYSGEDQPYVNIDFREEETLYYFKVSDNGIGMTNEQLENIFILFHQDSRNKESTGIGLNVVKRLIEKMRGNIQVSSELGKGTTVEFSIEKIA